MHQAATRELIVIPRDIAELAWAFTEAAIESLQAQTRELARSLN
jgi:hypothetical protein